MLRPDRASKPGINLADYTDHKRMKISPRIAWRVAQLGFQQPGRLALASVSVLGASIFGLLIPKLLGTGVDQASQLLREGVAHAGEARLALAKTGLLILCAGLLRGVLQASYGYNAEYVSQRVGATLRRAYFAKLQQLSFEFHDGIHSGDLITRGMLDLEGARQFIDMGILRVLMLLLMVGASIWLMMRTDVRMGLLALSFVPFAGGGAALLGRRMRGLWLRLQEMQAVLTRAMEENLQGIRVVRAFASHNYELANFDRAANATLALQRRRLTLFTSGMNSINTVYYCSLGLVLYFGSQRVRAGTLTVGEFTEFLAYMTVLINPLRMLGMIMNSWARATSCGARLFEIIDMEPRIQDAPNAQPLRMTQGGSLKFDHVDFGYVADKPVLHDISFEIQPGKTLGIVGPPGSGKSTIAHLVPRFYDVDGGSIRIDGHDIRDVTLDTLRRYVGVVQQEAFLFDTSVTNNVSYGDPWAEETRILDATRTAHIHDYVESLPEGYEARLGERGVALSGGQRQRMSIARGVVPGARRDDLRRFDRGDRRRDRAAPASRAAGADQGQGDDHHRAAPGLADARRRDHRARCRADRRARHARPADPRGRHVRRPVRAAVAIGIGPAGDRCTGRCRRGDGMNAFSNGIAGARQPNAALGSTDDRADEVFGTGLNPKVVRRFGPFLAPYRWRFVAVLVALLVATGSAIAIPMSIRDAVNHAVGSGGGRSLGVILAVFAALVITNALGTFAQQNLSARVAQQVIFDLRRGMFEHLQRVSLSFMDQTHVGRVMSRLQGDINALQEFLETSVTAVSDIVLLVGIMVVLVAMNWQLGLLTISVIPALGVVQAIWVPRARIVFARARDASSRTNAALAENINGIRTVQESRREAMNFELFSDRVESNFREQARAALLGQVITPTVELLTGVAMAIVIVVGGEKVLRGGLDVGVLVAYIFYVQRFFDPIRTLAMQYTIAQRAMTAGARIFEVLDVPVAIQDKPGALPLPADAPASIALDHVTFGYKADRAVLNDISIDIQPGQMVALVGPTGSGKTSIAALVKRFYDVWEGSVRVGGQDVRDVTMDSLGRSVAMVLQDPFLFTGTVLENIRYASGASEAEVIAAAKAVRAHDFIERLPLGYATPLGQRGNNLSLGQRQLVSFARALVADPKILILDEATANIDSFTEQDIQRALKVLFKGRTSLVIAHRLATVRDADKIVVLQHGHILEQGTHDELIAIGGLYAHLYTSNYSSFDDVQADPGKGGEARFAMRT